MNKFLTLLIARLPFLAKPRGLVTRSGVESAVAAVAQKVKAADGGYLVVYDTQSVPTTTAGLAEAAHHISQLLNSGRFVFSNCRERFIHVGGKRRRLIRFRFTDLVVHRILYDMVRPAMVEGLSSRVFSYRPGKSYQHAITEFSDFLRAHRRSRPLSSRRLFVFRLDIAEYTDSIPLDSKSRLWDELYCLAGASSPAHSTLLYGLLSSALRQGAQVGADREDFRTKGLPLGSPLCSVAANIFLRELDRELDQVGGAFYARYGDDILFAHDSRAVTESAHERVNSPLF